MDRSANKHHPQNNVSLFNSTMFVVLGQVGCSVFVIIAGSLVVGLWLDKLLDSRPLLTIISVIGSAPLTFLAVLWLVKRAVPRLNAGIKKGSDSNQEA